MLSSFVDSLFKVPYGTPIELPHASMWSKLVKTDFTSFLPRCMIEGMPKGTRYKEHCTARKTLWGIRSEQHSPRKMLRGTQPKGHNWETVLEGHYLRDTYTGTCSKGHVPRVTRDKIQGHTHGHVLRVMIWGSTPRDTSIGTRPVSAALLKVR